RIESVPALVVNGRYRIEITSSDASAVQRALALAWDLLMEDADGALTATAEAQPPVREAQVIAFEERIVGALKAQDYSGALELADEYRERNHPLRAEFLFLEQHAAREAGRDARAYSVMREFLRTIPREHPLYPRVESLHRARKAEAEVQVAQFNAARKQRFQGEAARGTHALTNSAAILEAVARDMVTIPGGEFRMGDVNGTGDTDELPLRSVRVPSFQMARYEVTFELYDLYCMATDGELPDDEGHGGPRHPVFNVDFTQMLAFIRWLNRQTGGNYRLPTEAEWEYAARAGSTADYPSGDEYLPGHANGERTGGADGWEKTAPVGSFPANAYGLHDMSGNVMERVQDCFNRSYAGAPVDGSAWMRGECRYRVSRGGDWLSGGRSMRIARRNFHQPEFGSAIIGFRLARDLP
nr:formylglycine-generating enzyme family protein [Pseudomonadales bacterium]